MRPQGDLPDPLLTASDVLDQVSTGVVVIDRELRAALCQRLRGDALRLPR